MVGVRVCEARSQLGARSARTALGNRLTQAEECTITLRPLGTSVYTAHPQRAAIRYSLGRRRVNNAPERSLRITGRSNARPTAGNCAWVEAALTLGRAGTLPSARLVPLPSGVSRTARGVDDGHDGPTQSGLWRLCSPIRDARAASATSDLGSDDQARSAALTGSPSQSTAAVATQKRRQS